MDFGKVFTTFCSTPQFLLDKISVTDIDTQSLYILLSDVKTWDHVSSKMTVSSNTKQVPRLPFYWYSEQLHANVQKVRNNLDKVLNLLIAACSDELKSLGITTELRAKKADYLQLKRQLRVWMDKFKLEQGQIIATRVNLASLMKKMRPIWDTELEINFTRMIKDVINTMLIKGRPISETDGVFRFGIDALNKVQTNLASFKVSIQSVYQSEVDRAHKQVNRMVSGLKDTDDVMTSFTVQVKKIEQNTAFLPWVETRNELATLIQVISKVTNERKRDLRKSEKSTFNSNSTRASSIRARKKTHFNKSRRPPSIAERPESEHASFATSFGTMKSTVSDHDIQQLTSQAMVKSNLDSTTVTVGMLPIKNELVSDWEKAMRDGPGGEIAADAYNRMMDGLSDE